MPIVGGDLRTVLAVDTATFGAGSLAFALWLFFTRRGHLRQILWLTLLSNLVRTLLPLLLLFDFSRMTRGSVEIYWLRWLVYAGVWGLCGLSHVLAKFSVQERFYQRWNMSLGGFGAAAFAVFIASRMAEEDQRILSLCIGGVLFLAGIAMLFIYAQRRDIKANLVYISTLLLMAASVVAFALGHAAWRRIELVYETVFYLCVDFLLYIVWPAVMLWLHCPCVVVTCNKKTDQEAVCLRQNQTWGGVVSSPVYAPGPADFNNNNYGQENYL